MYGGRHTVGAAQALVASNAIEKLTKCMMRRAEFDVFDEERCDGWRVGRWARYERLYMKQRSRVGRSVLVMHGVWNLESCVHSNVRTNRVIVVGLCVSID